MDAASLTAITFRCLAITLSFFRHFVPSFQHGKTDSTVLSMQPACPAKPDQNRRIHGVNGFRGDSSLLLQTESWFRHTLCASGLGHIPSRKVCVLLEMSPRLRNPILVRPLYFLAPYRLAAFAVAAFHVLSVLGTEAQFASMRDEL